MLRVYKYLPPKEMHFGIPSEASTSVGKVQQDLLSAVSIKTATDHYRITDWISHETQCKTPI